MCINYIYKIHSTQYRVHSTQYTLTRQYTVHSTRNTAALKWYTLPGLQKCNFCVTPKSLWSVYGVRKKLYGVSKSLWSALWSVANSLWSANRTLWSVAKISMECNYPLWSVKNWLFISTPFSPYKHTPSGSIKNPVTCKFFIFNLV